MQFGLTEVLLLLGGFGVIVAVLARRYGWGQGWDKRDAGKGDND